MMAPDQILAEIDTLPWQDRLRLFRLIYDRILRRDYKDFVGIDETFAKYHKAMLDVSGEDCTERTRRRSVVWARNIVAWQMTEDCFTTTQIGRCLGLDHSTVCHCRDAVKEMLGVSYYAWDAMVLAKMAEAIGETEERLNTD